MLTAREARKLVAKSSKRKVKSILNKIKRVAINGGSTFRFELDRNPTVKQSIIADLSELGYSINSKEVESFYGTLIYMIDVSWD